MGAQASTQQLNITVVDLSSSQEWRLTVYAFEDISTSIARGINKFRVGRIVWDGAELSSTPLSWEELGAGDEARIFIDETLTKDEWLASASQREVVRVLVDDVLAVNDGVSCFGLPLVSREKLMKGLELEGDQVKRWDMRGVGIRKLPRRFWSTQATAGFKVDLCGNPIKCGCCREKAGLPAVPEQKEEVRRVASLLSVFDTPMTPMAPVTPQSTDLKAQPSNLKGRHLSGQHEVDTLIDRPEPAAIDMIMTPQPVC